jgi:predicted Zn finger-like uncharacterized protein
MILSCPACSTRYLVDPRALGSAGRMVRCAKCLHTWHQTPPEDLLRPAALAGPLVVAPAAAPDRPAQLPALPRRRRPVGAIAATIALALILALGLSAVLARDTVATIWPRAVDLYAAVGLQASPRKSRVDVVVTPSRGVENGVAALILEGDIINATGRAQEIAKLVAILKDDKGREVLRWDFIPPQSHVEPGGSVHYRTIIPQVSKEATSVVVDVAE